MKINLFEIKMLKFHIIDWSIKKEKFLTLLDDNTFQRNQWQTCLSDRSRNNYLEKFAEIFNDELSAMVNELGIAEFDLDSVWCVQYHNGDWHAPHNHSGNGYSGIIYLDFDEAEHTPVVFVGPLNDPIKDTTQLNMPTILEGDLILVPSSLIHFTYPNTSSKTRRIIGFDIKFKK